MMKVLVYLSFLILYFSVYCAVAQVTLLGRCKDFDTVKYFDIERFTGEWYEIERYPTWYGRRSGCATKRISVCGRRVEIQHTYVVDNVKFVLHVNSTYAPGEEPVFRIEESNVDPLGIPLSVVATDYDHYAVIYGCRESDLFEIRYTSAWILSRNTTLTSELLEQARMELNDLPSATASYLQEVNQDEATCFHYFTAHAHGD